MRDRRKRRRKFAEDHALLIIVAAGEKNTTAFDWAIPLLMWYTGKSDIALDW